MYKSQQHTVSNVGPSVATKRKSLFESSSSKDVSKKRKLIFVLNPYLNAIFQYFFSN